MNYTRKSFSVTGPGTKIYADNWERTFRSPNIGGVLHPRPDGTQCSYLAIDVCNKCGWTSGGEKK